jgi:prepilin-type processing-associated H-X9-DG protein
MRYKVILLFLGLVLSAPSARYTQAPPDLSSPKATITTFLDAFSHNDVAGMAHCVQGAKPNPDLTSMFMGNGLSKAEIKDLMVDVTGDNAKVAVEFDVELGTPQADLHPTLSMVDLITLKRQGSDWLIVPHPLTGTTVNTQMQMGVRFLQTMVNLIGSDPQTLNGLTQARAKAQEIACLSNAKQIGLGTLMYVQDYDEVFPRKSASYKDQIWPYIKNEAAFHCALDPQGVISYSINQYIQGVTMARVTDPANTVLFYEGKNGSVNYRHNGRAAIVFVDGHAKMMSAEEMKSRVWKEANWTPKPTAKKQKPHGKSASRRS